MTPLLPGSRHAGVCSVFRRTVSVAARARPERARTVNDEAAGIGAECAGTEIAERPKSVADSVAQSNRVCRRLLRSPWRARRHCATTTTTTTPPRTMQPWPLRFTIDAKCPTTKARVSRMTLPHLANAPTPMFMPVATSGVMKGLTTSQLAELDCQIILGNTYHLALQPGLERMKNTYGGLHKFMRWPRAILTDSGGFQMVSLAKLMNVTEQGVTFVSHRDNATELVLRPEDSIAMQNAIGSDIMMQLDDVVSSTTTGPRVEEAMWRSIRWLDRCLAAHERRQDQNLFAIVQGGLDHDLRRICVEEMVKRNCPGYAIGGLSGGESKDEFWRCVSLCTDLLPEEKPRYCMGVGFPEDLVVCVALGVDMFDCVFPTRTARMGNALTRRGTLHLKRASFEHDYSPIEEDCNCSTCRDYTRSHIRMMFALGEHGACQLVSVHNIAFHMRLMRDMRDSITQRRFPEFVRQFMSRYFTERRTRNGASLDRRAVPGWIVDALASVGISLAPSDAPHP